MAGSSPEPRTHQTVNMEFAAPFFPFSFAWCFARVAHWPHVLAPSVKAETLRLLSSCGLQESTSTTTRPFRLSPKSSRLK